MSKERTLLWWLQNGKLLGSERVGEAQNVTSTGWDGKEAKLRSVEVPLGWGRGSERFLRRKTSVWSILSAVVGGFVTCSKPQFLDV